MLILSKLIPDNFEFLKKQFIFVANKIGNKNDFYKK